MIANEYISVGLSTKWKVPFGKAVYITGNIESLGKWNSEKALKLTYSIGDNWVIYLNIEKDQTIQYKFFVSNFDSVNKNQLTWENYEGNRKIELTQINQQHFPKTTVCSYNIRFLTERDQGDNHWDKRKDRICQYLNNKQYDVVGVQEATYPQKKYLEDHLKNYLYFGKARDLHKDEECGIFINNEKFVLVQDHYDWISESKQEGKVGYDAKLPRYFTSVLVAPKTLPSNCCQIPCLFIINLHLDHVGSEARKKGVEQTLQKCIKQRQNLIVSQTYKLIGCIIMGDFNLQEGSQQFKILKQNNSMKFKSMREIEGADKSFTFNGFLNRNLLRVGSFIINNKLTIDHMYFWIAQDSNLQALKFEIDKCESEQYLSDHYPITGIFG